MQKIWQEAEALQTELVERRRDLPSSGNWLDGIQNGFNSN